MACTTICIISLLLNIVFLAIITLLIMHYFKLRRQLKSLVKELDNNSLEHFLNTIKKKGFDFTLKPKTKKKE
jgi:predicted PurR-regulated permease PerM